MIVLGADTRVIGIVANNPVNMQLLRQELAIYILTVILSSVIRKPTPLRGVEGLKVQ